ncbi:MAG: tyrosine--tRNA ligase [Alphaproteobacteria bacterium]|nr:tyrosine--tRNA ligase [Alphaproteobacteria bacterium]
MARFRSDFLNVLSTRGFLQDCSDPEGLDARLAGGIVTAYAGFDATAPSLHAGHLTQIMLLSWFQETGHRPIALMGGGTTKVGDPTGKEEMRKLLSDADIAANIASIRGTFGRILDFGGGPTGAILVNNADWLDELKYIPFLRDVGRHFTVNRMLTFDSVKLRLEREQPFSFLEFNYMILQAYDFVELYRRAGCTLQVGGSDQWGNIVNGIDLARRMVEAELFGLTSPLLTTASGRKMGKTEKGAVWLNADMLSPYEFWQYWRNVDDADVEMLLKRFTRLPLDEVARLAALGGAEINEAKKILADEVTALVHSRAEADAARKAAEETFEAGGAAAGLPSVDVPRAELETGIGALALFVRAGLAASNGEARRLVQGGGARVNDAPLTDEKTVLGPADLNADGAIKLSAGKKKHALVRAV